jgi:hypothetical protein
LRNLFFNNSYALVGHNGALTDLSSFEGLPVHSTAFTKTLRRRQ